MGQRFNLRGRYFYIVPCLWIRNGADFIELNLGWLVWLKSWEWDKPAKPTIG